MGATGGMHERTPRRCSDRSVRRRLRLAPHRVLDSARAAATARPSWRMLGVHVATKPAALQVHKRARQAADARSARAGAPDAGRPRGAAHHHRRHPRARLAGGRRRAGACAGGSCIGRARAAAALADGHAGARQPAGAPQGRPGRALAGPSAGGRASCVRCVRAAPRRRRAARAHGRLPARPLPVTNGRPLACAWKAGARLGRQACDGHRFCSRMLPIINISTCSLS